MWRKGRREGRSGREGRRVRVSGRMSEGKGLREG